MSLESAALLERAGSGLGLRWLRLCAGTKLAKVGPADTAAAVPGDLNGDGVVDQSELNAVVTNYWPNSPWLQMNDPAKLPDGLFQFALTNASAWLFSVEVTANFITWAPLGPAYPVSQFHDPASTNSPMRYYRLRWPWESVAGRAAPLGTAVGSKAAGKGHSIFLFFLCVCREPFAG